MSESVRDIVRDMQRELRTSPDLLPSRAAELLTMTTALLGNINDELREADLCYKRVLLASMQAHKAANRARIEAEVSPEYLRRQEAAHAHELAVEMIRSLKAFIKTKQEEMRLAQ